MFPKIFYMICDICGYAARFTKQFPECEACSAPLDYKKASNYNPKEDK